MWGRLRAQRAASEANAEAAALDYAYARQSLAATTAKLWYLAVETRQLLSLSEQAVQIYGDLLELVQLRRNAGKDSDLDVVDVRAKLETAQSDVERARESYGEARRALEVLIGRYPAAEIEVAAVYPALPPLGGHRHSVGAARAQARYPRGRAGGARGVSQGRGRAARAAPRLLDLARRRPAGRPGALARCTSTRGSSRRASACRSRSTRAAR